MSNPYPPVAVRPSFFKPLKNNYSDELTLPLGFVRKHRNILPENAKLRIRSGMTWPVKVKKPEDEEDCYFTEGWSDFVGDVGLQGTKLLLFWLIADDATFDVSVYDSDSNELDFSVVANPGSPSSSSSDDDVVVVEDERNVRLPRFHFQLTKYYRYRACLRKRFTTAAGLIGKTSVVLQYLGRRRYWKAVLRQEKTCLVISRGWNDFREGNKLVFGRIYSFEFSFDNNLILVSDYSATSESANMHSNFESSSVDHVWRFVKELKHHNFSAQRLDMPKAFVMGMGMGIAKGSRIRLKDSQGKEWLVNVTDRNMQMFSMTRGFIEFLRENHMQVGDILLFESVPNSVDKVVKFRVMEKEAGKEMLARSKMGGIILG